MSAETLRRAASLMRERAQAARAGRWTADDDEVRAPWRNFDHDVAALCSGSLPQGNAANAAHIAGMDPAVALAVADLLRKTADRIDGAFAPDVFIRHDTATQDALTIARAYLGESA